MYSYLQSQTLEGTNLILQYWKSMLFFYLSQRQSNASQTLCDIIRLSRDQANQLQETSQPDPLLTVLES